MCVRLQFGKPWNKDPAQNFHPKLLHRGFEATGPGEHPRVRVRPTSQFAAIDVPLCNGNAARRPFCVSQGETR